MSELLRSVHRWIGLALALPVISMGLSGFMLAVTPAFDALRLPPPSSAAGVPHDAADILDAARALAPPGMAPGRLALGPTARSIAQVELTRPQQRQAEMRLLIDPVTLGLVGREERPGRFYAWVHGWHEFLLLPGRIGHNIVGGFGVALFVMGVSGIPIWWPRKGFAVSRKARGWRLHRELHGAVGIWTVALLLLQSLGGASMAFPQAARAVLGVAPFSFPSAPHSGEPVGLRPALAAALAAVPDATIRDIRLATAGRPMFVVLQLDGAGDGAPPAIVAVDAGGSVLSVQDPRTQPWGLRLLSWLRALHTAGGLGPAWRGLICAFGLCLPVFAATGVGMWLIRQRNRRRALLSRQVILRGIEG